MDRATQKYGLRVRYRKFWNDESGADEWKLKITFKVEKPAVQVFKCLQKGYTRQSKITKDQIQPWNAKLIESNIEEFLDENHCILYEVYKSFNSPYVTLFLFFSCFVCVFYLLSFVQN